MAEVTNEGIAAQFTEELLKSSKELSERIKKEGWPVVALSLAVNRVNMLSSMEQASPQALAAFEEVTKKAEGMLGGLLLEQGRISKSTLLRAGIEPILSPPQPDMGRQTEILKEVLDKTK